MRKLTIKYPDFDIESPYKVSIFITDENRGSDTINGEVCLYLGSLNGDITEFDIPENSATVYAMQEKSSGSSYSRSVIPSGAEDVELSGFKDEASEGFKFIGADYNRKIAYGTQGPLKKKLSTKRIVFIVSIVLTAIFVLIAISPLLSTSTEPKVFFGSNGFSITLTKAFEYNDTLDADFAVYSKLVDVFADEFTKAEYGEYFGEYFEKKALLMFAFELHEEEIYEKDGLIYCFPYSKYEDEKLMDFALEDDEGDIWIISFDFFTEDESQELYDNIFEWVKSIDIICYNN